MVLSETIVGSILDLINNTGSVGGGSYTPGSFIDPYMQNTLKNRSDNMAVKKVIFGGPDPHVEIVPGPIERQPMTAQYRYTQGYTEKKTMEIRIYAYTKNLRSWTDPDNVEHKDDHYCRTYLEYLSNGLKRYAPADLKTIRMPVLGTISDIEQFPEDSSMWWGFIPVQISWYVSGSSLT